MKKLLLILICFQPFLIYAQHSERVLEIKKMYKETKSYEKKKDCKKIRWFDSMEPESATYENSYKRKITRCSYPKRYSTISIYFEETHCGPSPAFNAYYYYKDDKLYFAHIINKFLRTESYDPVTGLFEDFIWLKNGIVDSEIRLYFKSDGEIEKVLVDNGDGNVKITEKNKSQNIVDSALRFLNIDEFRSRISKLNE